MQQLKHKRFIKGNELNALPIGHCYVPATSGFGPDSYRDGNMSNDDKTRPWFKR